MPLWHHRMAYWSCTDAGRRIYYHGIRVHELPLALTVHFGNTPINFICHRGMVTLLYSSHLQVLLSFTAFLHWTWHLVHNNAPVYARYIRVMDLRRMDMTSTKVAVVCLRCSPLCSSSNNGHHPQVHLECLQDCHETIQPIRKHLPA